jgi:Ca2+-dependent lipid-binding protein
VATNSTLAQSDKLESFAVTEKNTTVSAEFSPFDWTDQTFSLEYAEKKFEVLERIIDSGVDNWLHDHFLYGYDFNNSLIILASILATWFLTFFRFSFAWILLLALGSVNYFSNSLKFYKLSVAQKQRLDRADKMVITDCKSALFVKLF